MGRSASSKERLRLEARKSFIRSAYLLSAELGREIERVLNLGRGPTDGELDKLRNAVDRSAPDLDAANIIFDTLTYLLDKPA